MRTTTILISFVALGVAAFISGDARATHRQTPFMMALTTVDGSRSFRPFTQGESARYISFDSPSDHLGNGSTGSEIFLQDNLPPRNLDQVTRCQIGDSARPSSTANGDTVVFESTSDLAKPTISRCRQLLPRRRIMRAQQNKGTWVFDEITGGLAPADCRNAAVTRRGFRIAFQCSGDLRRNGSQGTNLYFWRNQEMCEFGNNPTCSKVFQLTPRGNWVSENPTFNLNEDQLAFNSNAPIDGRQNGFQQIWVWGVLPTVPVPPPVRITSGAGDSTNPSLTRDGRFVTFQSRADLLSNGSSGWEIFLYDRETGQLRQISNGAGDSTNPSINGSGRFIIYLSTGNFGGGSGPHIYLYDLLDEATYQVTSGVGSAGRPVATRDGQFFFDTDQDPMQIGLRGRHVYVLNTFNQLPPRALGGATFRLLPGTPANPSLGKPAGAGGSSVRITSAATPPVGGNPLTTFVSQAIGEGQLLLNIITRDADGVGTVTASKVAIPPVLVPSWGHVCFAQTQVGRGEIDCKGGIRDGLDVRTFQDHVTNDADPSCQIGCREGSECAGPFKAPNGEPCPRCAIGVCADGPRAGDTCDFDAQCPGKECVRDPETGLCVSGVGACDVTRPRADERGVARLGTCLSGPRKDLWCDVDGECPSTCMARTCETGSREGELCETDAHCDPGGFCNDGQTDVCQGPTVTTFDGTYGPGDMTLRIPMTAKFSTNSGVDGVPCNGDDTYAISEAGAVLRLTTGTATATIADADYQSGLVIGASETGAPFSCDRWQSSRGTDLAGARLVGALTFLNVPQIPAQHDAIMSFRFAAEPAAACVGAGCPAPCAIDVQCDDGNKCNGAEFCHLGTCRAGNPVSCSDGNECNGEERCNPADGVCQPGAVTNCDNGNACTTDVCDVAFLCQHVPIPAMEGQPCSDGDLCTGHLGDGARCPDGVLCDTCHAGQCLGAPTDFASTCSDGDVCNGVETCNPATGSDCLGGQPLVCGDDGNPCTDDVCDATLGCNPPNTDPCNDDNACTGTDVCTDGHCLGTLTPAAAACNAGDGNLCNGIERCDPTNGACVTSPLVCEDGNVCTTDACDPQQGCTYTDNTNPCDDGNACTAPDVCQAGTCVGIDTQAAIDCRQGDGNVCNGIEQCNTATGACEAAPLVCDDGNPCIAATCHPEDGCRYTFLNGPCDDGDACTSQGECMNGVCLTTPTPVAQSCNDGNACNGVETCDAATGACMSTDGLDCDDGDPCTVDRCDAARGCVRTSIDGLSGALCELDFVLDELTTPPTGAIRGRNVQRRLSKIASRARGRIDEATKSGGRPAMLLLRGASKKLQKFVVKATKNGQRDLMSEAFTHEVVGRAATARKIVKTEHLTLKNALRAGRR